MDFLGLTISFVIIIIMVYRKIDVGISMIAGSLILALFLKIPLSGIAEISIHTVTSFSTIQLALIVIFITGMGYAMKVTGLMDGFINGITKAVKDERKLMVIIPAFIGTLSVPGGAILSAPMVEELGERINLPPENKTAANLMYRHIGYYIFPLYSAFILIAQLSNIKISSLILFNLPIMIIGVAVSFYILFKGYNVNRRDKQFLNFKDTKDMFLGIVPITITLTLAMLLGVPFYYSILVGLMIALGLNIKENYLETYWERVKGVIKDGFTYKMAVAVLGIMFFKDIIEHSGVMTSLATSLTDLGIPLWVLAVILSFLTSYFSGLHIASIGINAPIFLPLIPVEDYIPFLGLLFTGAITGYWVSPLHLCLILTKEYFKSDIMKVYRIMFWPMVSLMTTCLLMFTLYLNKNIIIDTFLALF